MKKLLVLAILIAGVMMIGCKSEDKAADGAASGAASGSAEGGRDGVGSTTVQEGPGAADAASRVGSKAGGGN